MRKFKFINKFAGVLLTALVCIANISSQIGAGTASSWGSYQPKVPDKLRH